MSPPGISEEGVRHELLQGNVLAWIGMYATYAWATAEVVYGIAPSDRVSPEERVEHLRRSLQHLCERFKISDAQLDALGKHVHDREDLFGPDAEL